MLLLGIVFFIKGSNSFNSIIAWLLNFEESVSCFNFTSLSVIFFKLSRICFDSLFKLVANSFWAINSDDKLYGIKFLEISNCIFRALIKLIIAVIWLSLLISNLFWIRSFIANDNVSFAKSLYFVASIFINEAKESSSFDLLIKASFSFSSFSSASTFKLLLSFIIESKIRFKLSDLNRYSLGL